MIHPALYLLIKMRLWGMCRHLLNGLRSPKKAVFFLIGFIMICAWLGPQVMMAFWMPSQSNLDIQPYVPFALLFLALIQLFTSANERAVMFQQNEIDFLFPAPFSRHQLLLFKILTSYGGVLFSSVIFTVIGLRYISNGWVAFLGIFLAMSFVHLLSMSIVLVRQTMDESIYTRIWQAGIFMVLAVVGFLGWEYRMVLIEIGLNALINEVYNNPYIYFVLAPFDVFGYLITADSWLYGMLVWLPAAIGVNFILLLLVFQLDKNYLEVSLQVTQRMQKRVQQVKRGGSVFASQKTESKKAFGLFPRLGGVGSIAWRQYVMANRNTGSWFFTFFMLASVSVCVYLFCKNLPPASVIWVVFGCLLYFSMFVTQYIRYDFRSDLDQFEWLKQFPMDSAAIAAGMIAVPVIFLTLLEVIVFSLPFVLRGEFVHLFYLGLLILPFNIFLVGVDNFVFLLFPTRMYKAQGDFGMFGKIILLILFKFMILACIFIIAVGCGLIMFWLSGYRDSFLFITTWIVALLETLMVLPALAWAFDRFDVTSDIPPA